MAKLRLLLLDKPSMALAPYLVDQLLSMIRALKGGGLTTLLVEQNVHRVLAIADHVYPLETGTMLLNGTAAEIQADQRAKEAYLGV